jgi:hypothetical protein
MSSTLFEIIELANGDFVLQRSGTADEPLVSIKFSPEAKKFLSEASSEVARSMIEAGIQEVEEIMDGQISTEILGSSNNRVIH